MTAFDTERNRIHYARIIVLNPPPPKTTEEIQGLITNGNININGSSAMRRTGSLSMIANDDNNKITNPDNLISIKSRIKVEIGLQADDINRGEIYWFDLGHYVITGASITRNLQGLSISINIKDYMALINGELGGTIPTGAIHSPIENEKGELEPVEFDDLIRTVITEYTDVDLTDAIIDIKYSRSNIAKIEKTGQETVYYLKNTARWTSNKEVYGIKKDYNGEGTGGEYYLMSYNQPTSIQEEDLTYNYNDNIGYKLTKFTFPSDKELSSNAGETVASVLDKIKNALGNFEYFFDVDGQFHFQEIKNGINQGTTANGLADAVSEKYLEAFDPSLIVYTFDENTDFVISYSNNPQYSQVKNDITLWGERGDGKQPLRYRLVVDHKPTFTKGLVTYNSCEIYEDNFGVKRAKKVAGKTAEIELQDWRQYLYFDYILNDNKNRHTIAYGKELKEELPKIMDIATGEFYAGRQATDSAVKAWLNSMTYFLDILDPDEVTNADAKAMLEQYTVDKIGRRKKVINDKDVNTLFNPNFPDIVYIELGTSTTSLERSLANQLDVPFTQVPKNIAQHVAIGSAINSAYDGVRAILSEVLSYNQTVSLSMVPIYHLDVNQVVTIEDEESDTHGEYIITSMSLPLAYNGNMTLSAKKINTRI